MDGVVLQFLPPSPALWNDRRDLMFKLGAAGCTGRTLSESIISLRYKIEEQAHSRIEKQERHKNPSLAHVGLGGGQNRTRRNSSRAYAAHSTWAQSETDLGLLADHTTAHFVEKEEIIGFSAHEKRLL